MSINLSEDAVHALNRSAAAAARDRHEAVAPIHLLAGVLSEKDAALLEALQGMGLSLDDLPPELLNLPRTYEGHLPFTPESHDALTTAVEFAADHGGGATTSTHLLLGVARTGVPACSQLLDEWGFSAEALAQQLASQAETDAESAETPEPAEPAAASLRPGPAQPVRSGVVGAVLLLGFAVACGPAADSRSSDDPADNASADPATEATADPFPAAPPDGPRPEIGPAPADYRPTAAGAPSTDIWIGLLDRSGDALAVRALVNATDRDGYDNQPAFAPVADVLYYVAAVDTIQTEVFRHDLATGATQQVTRTPEASEFSPTIVPGQEAFSAIHESRGKQYLWRYATTGDEIGPVFSTVEPVGYHAWADERTVAVFVLGDPPTLQLGDAISGEIRVVAENPGRSIHRVPGTAVVSFVRKATDDEWWIERLDPSTGTTERIVRTLSGREDYAWTPEGEILMGDGEALYAWTPESEWVQVGGLEAAAPDTPGGEAGEISRIAVSPDGTRIALVRNRPAPDQP